MAARSANITLDNHTSLQLVRVSASLSGGMWSDNLYPSSIINAYENGTWQSESDGVMTGTEGTATYQLSDGSGLVTINWDVPYAGSNSYSFNIPNIFVIFQNSDGSGDNAITSFELQAKIDIATAAVNAPPLW